MPRFLLLVIGCLVRLVKGDVVETLHNGLFIVLNPWIQGCYICQSHMNVYSQLPAAAIAAVPQSRRRRRRGGHAEVRFKYGGGGKFFFTNGEIRIFRQDGRFHIGVPEKARVQKRRDVFCLEIGLVSVDIVLDAAACGWFGGGGGRIEMCEKVLVRDFDFGGVRVAS